MINHSSFRYALLRASRDLFAHYLVSARSRIYAFARVAPGLELEPIASSFAHAFQLPVASLMSGRVFD